MLAYQPQKRVLAPVKWDPLAITLQGFIVL